MRAVVIHEYGDPSVLRYEHAADPECGPQEVLVKVAAAGINPVDIQERAGSIRSYRPVVFPGILGWDVSGTVEKLGAEVEDLAVGDLVVGWAYHTYAQLCAVRADLLVKVPSGLDLVSAAALPLVSMTGSQLVLVGADVRAGQTVLVSGAVGGVGRAAVYAARLRGAWVIAGVQSKQLEEARLLGADDVVALDDEAAVGRLASVDVVANTVRGQSATKLLDKVRPGGMFVSVTGAPAGAETYSTISTVAFVSKQDRANLTNMVNAARSGDLVIPIGARLPLSEAADGHRLVEKGGIGKVLLVP